MMIARRLPGGGGPDDPFIADPARLAALRALSLADGRADAAFDRLTRLAARFLGASAALVNVVEADRQVTRSAYGRPEVFNRGDEAALADSMCRLTIVTGSPVVIPDTRGDERVAHSRAIDDGIAAYAGVPLTLSSGHTLGTLCVVDEDRREWTSDEVQVLRDLALAATTELELLAQTIAAEARAAAEGNVRRLEQVQSITDIGLVQATLDDTLAAILGRLRQLLGTDTATVLLVTEDGRDLKVRSSSGLEGEVQKGVTVPVGVGIVGRIAATREPMIVEDVGAAGPVSPILRNRLASLIGAPLLLGDELLGVIHVGSNERRVFAEDDLRLLTVASGRIAAAIERARLFDAERDARRAAEAASRAKSEFLAVMSHELRTPLNAIGGFVELLDEGVCGPVTEKQRGMLRRIRGGQQQLTRLISDILQYVDLEHAGGHPGAGTTDVRAVLGSIADTLVTRAGNRGITVEVAPCPVAVMVAATGDALSDIMWRLVDNALKFTPDHGRIRIECATHGRQARVVVSDSGPGIPTAHWETVFEPFGRTDTTYRRATEGVGLGLAIARARARQLGGDLAAGAADGGGACFLLTLPLEAPTEGFTSP